MSVSAQTDMQRHWAQVNEAGFVAGMRFLFWVARVFGRWPFRLVLYPVLAWYVLTRRIARTASADYLRRVRAFGNLNDVDPGLRGVLRHFGAFAECILDKLLLWGGLAGTGDVTLHGEKPLNDDIAAKRGGVIVCSHFGNLELCRVLGRQHPGLRLTVLVHTKHARKFNQMLARLDPASQMNLFQVTEMTPATAMLLNERVARGEFVVIAGDRVPVTQGQRTCEASFLGDTAPFPVGPYVLAGLLQCPLYLLFSMRIGDRSEVHFEKLRDEVRLPRKARDEALATLAQEYATRLERFCVRAPFQWFNFYDFWHSPERGMSDASR